MIDSFVHALAFFFIVLLVAAFFLTRTFKQIGQESPEAQAKIKKDVAAAADLILKRIAKR